MPRVGSIGFAIGGTCCSKLMWGHPSTISHLVSASYYFSFARFAGSALLLAQPMAYAMGYDLSLAARAFAVPAQFR